MENLISIVKKIKDKNRKPGVMKTLFYLLPGIVGVIFSLLDLHFNIFRNNILATIIISFMAIWIFASIILAHLKGFSKGGIEFIILLIPTLVWLLPEYQGVIDALTYITFFLFIVAICILIWSMVYLKIESNYRRAVIKSSTLLRISFLFVILVNSLALTFLTIDWGNEVIGDWWNNTNAKMPSSWVILIIGITLLIILTIIFISAADIFLNDSRRDKLNEEKADWKEKTQHIDIHKIKKKNNKKKTSY
ncbi:MAG: hypothetical protein KAG14_01245 [Mycoplasmataceae bacterium]|nr:hypothetical protein [Mycoplasmataceae bacterium]